MVFGTVGAQSVLSLPNWIETRVQFAHTSSLSTPPLFQLAATQTLENPNPETPLIPTGNPNSAELLILEKAPSPQEIDFYSITALLKNTPQQALTDLEQIRDFLAPEEVLILEIQIVYHLGQYEQTEILSDGFLETFPDSPFFPRAYYYYYKSLFLQQKFAENQPELNEIVVTHLPGELQADLLQIFGQDALAREDIQRALRFFLRQLETAPQQSPVISQEILTILSTISQLEFLKNVENEFSHFDFIKAELPYLRLKLLLDQAQYQPALEVVETLLSDTALQNIPDRLEYLSDLQKRLRVLLQVNPRRIGVILPLSSDRSQAVRLTQEILEGLRLGLLAFKETEKAEGAEETNSLDSHSQELAKLGPIELIFRDSELDPNASINAVRELVEEEHVIAIIGPITRKTSEAAAQEAQRLEVPLISLSLTSSIPDIGSYIFRNNQSWEQEMKALVRYAFDYKNARRFLILYPSTNKGNNAMALFFDEVTHLGGIIRGGEVFDLGQETFVQQFEKFTNLDRLIPLDEQEIMKEFEEKLEPLHDFDALFIPIGRSNIDELNVLLPYLAFYKMNDIVLLGDSGWNDYSVVSAIDKHVKDTVFVDNFFKQSAQAHVQRFVRLHERYFLRHLNYKGPSSYSAYSYDTVTLLMELLALPKNGNHFALQQALLKMEPYSGVTGITTFLANGEAHRELKVLTIQSGKIVSVN